MLRSFFSCMLPIDGAKVKTRIISRYDPVSRRVIDTRICNTTPDVCCNIQFDAGGALSNFTDVVYDDGTGKAIDAGHAATQACT